MFSKLENSDVVGRFPGTYELSKLNHEDLKILNHPIGDNEIEAVIKALLRKAYV